MNHYQIELIIKQLTRIANALEAKPDFSQEDAAVLSTGQKVKDALGHINQPNPIRKEHNNADIPSTIRRGL